MDEQIKKQRLTTNIGRAIYGVHYRKTGYLPQVFCIPRYRNRGRYLTLTNVDQYICRLPGVTDVGKVLYPIP
jgi:hypothetical protein